MYVQQILKEKRHNNNNLHERDFNVAFCLDSQMVIL